MEYIVQYGDTLSGIAEKYLSNPYRWPEIARLNQLNDPDFIFVGQRLRLPVPVARPSIMQQLQNFVLPSTPIKQPPATAVPARFFPFVVADEINFLKRKVVRKVAFPKNLQTNTELVKQILNAEKYGFIPKDPTSNVSIGRHVLGMTKSRYISTSERLLGSPRFHGKRFWIDVAKLKQSGGIIHEADEIARDLGRLAAKAKDTRLLQYIDDIRYKSLIIDKEILIEGSIPASAVKSTKAMAMTRGLQVVQCIGIIISAYNLSMAGAQSYQQGSVKPITAESVRQIGGWGAAFAGMKLGATVGGLFGITTGPGAVLTAAGGALIFGTAGYFAFDWIADYIHED
jgi:LysM repeat protein